MHYLLFSNAFRLFWFSSLTSGQICGTQLHPMCAALSFYYTFKSERICFLKHYSACFKNYASWSTSLNFNYKSDFCINTKAQAHTAIPLDTVLETLTKLLILPESDTHFNLLPIYFLHPHQEKSQPQKPEHPHPLQYLLVLLYLHSL